MAKREHTTNQGQLPDFVTEETGYLFESEFEQGILFYLTKWSPNTKAIIEIARHFNVGFKHNYEEYGNQIFGEAVYKNGQLSVIELDHLDLESFDFDPITESHIFEGSHFELIDQIIEMLIFRKRCLQNSSNLKL